MKADVPRTETRAAWLFLAPALTLLVIFFFLPIVAAFLMSFTDFDIYAVADPHNMRVIGARNYARLSGNPVFWLALKNTFYFVAGRRTAHRRDVARGGFTGERKGRSSERALPNDLLCSLRHDARRRRGRVAVPLPPRIRSHQLRARDRWWTTGELARRPAVGDARHHPDGGVEELRLQHADLHRRAAERYPRSLYEAAQLDGAGAWHRFRHITLPMLAPTLLFVGVDHHDRLFPALRRAVRDDPRRPAASTTSMVLLMYEEGFRWWRMGIRRRRSPSCSSS